MIWKNFDIQTVIREN